MLGVVMLAPYLAAWSVGDLRKGTVAFVAIFFAAFALYAGVTVLALRMRDLSRRALVTSFALAALMQGILVLTPPTLSDDMYRYVWEGRIQAHGFSPYLYPPNAPELAHLRDDAVWRHVNRKGDVTIYPPAAELAFALLWRIWPDSVRWFQVAMSLGALLAGMLLVQLLQTLEMPAARVLIYLWSPLLLFETAHGAHVDGLVLPLLVGAWLARARERDGIAGALLGLAIAVKLYPLLLFPALWRPDHPQGRWRMPLAAIATVALAYLPYLWWNGAAVIGFLPKYFGERFNVGLAGLLRPLWAQSGIDPDRGLMALTALALALLAGWMLYSPAPDGETAIRRCIWLTGAFTLLTQNLFPWYMLWVLPLAALFLRPGRLAGLRADGWTGWWLFCGLVGLAYTFFVNWRPVPAAIWAQFVPLYALLMVDLARRLWARRQPVK